MIFCLILKVVVGNEEWIMAQAPLESPFYRGVLKQMFPEWFKEVEMKENDIQGL